MSNDIWKMFLKWTVRKSYHTQTDVRATQQWENQHTKLPATLLQLLKRILLVTWSRRANAARKTLHRNLTQEQLKQLATPPSGPAFVTRRGAFQRFGLLTCRRINRASHYSSNDRYHWPEPC